MSRINEKEGTAFDYFNDLRFFENDEDRIWYMNSLNKEEKAKLHGTYEAFYRTVWETYEHDVDAIERFFVKTIKRCNSQAILEDFYKWKKESYFVILSKNTRFLFKVQNYLPSNMYILMEKNSKSVFGKNQKCL